MVKLSTSETLMVIKVGTLMGEFNYEKRITKIIFRKCTVLVIVVVVWRAYYTS